MMKFRTEIKPENKKGFIDHSHKIIGLGSCFADRIQTYLNIRQFQLLSSPFGIQFNPVSIEKNIRNAISKKVSPAEKSVNENLIIERDGYYFHHDFHSKFTCKNRSEFIDNIKTSQSDFADQLKTTNRLIITFGTAWIYRHIKENEIVANCHKIPQKEFKKELLKLDELITLYSQLFNDLKEFNPALEIILTVSPVRHTKNGLHENNISKSILLLLCNDLINNNNYVHYFPAYELVIDELRDYRFYANDMIHPTAQAVEYVFNHFQATYFTEKTIEITELCKKQYLLSSHKDMFPTDAKSQEKEKKIKELTEQITILKSKF